MAQLIVPNIDEALVRELEVRAARKGRSAEEEHREIPESVALRKLCTSDAREGIAGCRAILSDITDVDRNAETSCHPSFGVQQRHLSFGNSCLRTRYRLARAKVTNARTVFFIRPR